MSSKRTPADEAERRISILEAARSCLLQFGYGKTSMEDIARRAGLSRPLLYRSFKNKEEVVAALFAEMYAGQYPRIEEALAAPGTRRERLLQACRIAILEPWEDLATSPMSSEFFEACSAIVPEVEAAHEKRMLRYVQTLLGDKALAEVFVLALEGLMVNQPALAVLRRRVELLVERFVARA